MRQILDPAIGLIDAGHIDFIIEGDGGRLVRILIAADDAERVDPVLEIGLNGMGSTLYGPRMVPFQ